jgi:hypothetical protein
LSPTASWPSGAACLGLNPRPRAGTYYKHHAAGGASTGSETVGWQHGRGDPLPAEEAAAEAGADEGGKGAAGRARRRRTAGRARRTAHWLLQAGASRTRAACEQRRRTVTRRGRD